MILGTEVNEFVSNRQQSKIQYLSQENRYLQEYIQDLENALKLNKQAMQITMETMKKNNQDSTLSFGSSQNNQYERIIQHLNDENLKMMESQSKQQRNMSNIQTKLLLQEQIAEEQQNYFKDLIADLEYKLIELKRNIHDKEYAIQELERVKPIQEKEGQLIKLVEILNPTEQNMKMHDELENVRNVLNKITQDAQALQEQNGQLKEVNYNLKREIWKLRIVLRSQVNYQIMKDFVYNEYLEKTDQNIELNNEIQVHRNKLEQLHNEMYGASSLGYGFSPEPQQLKYLNKNERMIYQERLHKMETMVKGFKELFEKEKQNYQYVAKQYNELLKKYEQCSDNNELLIRSNQLKDIRLEKLHSELGFYKKQTQQYMEQLKTRKPFGSSICLNQEQDIAVGIFSPRFTNNQQLESTRNLSNNKSKQSFQLEKQEEQVQEVKKPVSKKPFLKELIIEDDQDDQNYCMTARGQPIKQREVINQPILQYYSMSKQECVDFLRSMQLDFFMNFDLNSVKKQQLMRQMKESEEQSPIRIKRQQSFLKSRKRSFSNPFLYFSSIDNNIQFTKPPKKSALAIAKNEIQAILTELQDKKKTQQEQPRRYDPFDIDISNIDMGRQPQQKKNIFADGDMSFVSNYEPID
ncbi:hypothetical protein pb186bvf_014355 [Paramecium bursaria]